MNAMLLMMGGTGTRFGAARPKQYTLIEDIPLFAYIIRKVDMMNDLLGRLVIVSHEDWLDYVEQWCRIFLHCIPYDVVAGGETRSESVLCGLTKLSEYAEDQDIVLIHDATHPYIDEEGMRNVIDAVHKYGGATLASGNYDTIYKQDGDGILKQVLQRTDVVAGASPEAFRFGEIHRIYREASREELEAMTSAGAIALAHQIPMKVVPAQYLNLKITYQRDMELFVHLRKEYFFPEAVNAVHEKMELIKLFDQFCKDNTIEYFLYDDMLVGSVHYGTVLPGCEELPWDLGMRRSEYEKLQHLLSKLTEQYGWEHNEAELGIRSSQLCLRRNYKLPETGRMLQYEIYIMPFDDVPVGADDRKFFVRKAKWRNTYLNRVYLAKDGSQAAMRKKQEEGMTRDGLWKRLPTKRVYHHLVKAAQKYHGKADTQEIVGVMGYQTKIIALDELYPLVNRPFHGLMLPGSKKYESWTMVKTPETQERVEQIQQVDLLLLAELHRVCQLIGVGYFLCGGSMLGYLRHGGFIPWDDDMDVGMLRKDYDIFLREADNYLNHELFFLQTRESDPEIPYLFSKIRVNQTEYITTYNERRNFHKGVCLDLFPFDVVPNERSERKNFCAEVEKAAKRHNFIVNRQVPEPVYESSPQNVREAWNRIRGKVNRSIYKSFSLKKTQKKYLEVVTRYNGTELTPDMTVASFVPTYTEVKISDLLPYQEIDFEGVPALLMHHPEVFLRMQYGDYMQIPPEHQQMGHDLIRWSVNLPDMPQEGGKTEWQRE